MREDRANLKRISKYLVPVAAPHGPRAGRGFSFGLCSMASEWIKWVKGFAKKPEVVRIAKALKIHRLHAAGMIMEKVFEWTDDNITAEDIDEDGNAIVTLGALPLDVLDAQTEVPGLADAMTAAGWIIVRSDSLVFPHFDRHNGNSAKTRALTARRGRRFRSSDKRERNARSVTTALPEERRGEEIKKDSKDLTCLPESKPNLNGRRQAGKPPNLAEHRRTTLLAAGVEDPALTAISDNDAVSVQEILASMARLADEFPADTSEHRESRRRLLVSRLCHKHRIKIPSKADGLEPEVVSTLRSIERTRRNRR